MGKITKSNQKKIGGPITTMKYKLPQNNPLKSNKKCKNHYRNQNIIFLKKKGGPTGAPRLVQLHTLRGFYNILNQI
jgi:hypothetical protein